MKIILVIIVAAIVIANAAAHALADNASEKFIHIVREPHGQAPIGVMGTHMHMAGKFMLSYRYMRMEMEGSRDSNDDVSTSNVLARFPVAPLNMTTEKHMFGAMYAPANWVTAMLMVPFIEKEMDHVNRMGARFTTESSGIGDIGLSVAIQLYDDSVHDFHINAGLSVPSGSIDKRDDTPAQANALLPYPMQLGSGTLDLSPGVTYTGFRDQWSWGGQFGGVLRLARNAEDYSFGDRVFLTGWGAVKLLDWASASVRLTGQTWGDIDGRDIRFDSTQVQTVDPDLQAGTRVDTSFGLNLLFPSSIGILSGHRVSFEIGLPVYQDLDGPQLETDWFLILGWQKVF